MRLTIAVPALNEQAVIGGAVRRILDAVSRLEGWEAAVVVADNGSVDGTGDVVKSLMAGEPRLKYIRLDARGKGLAIKAAWRRYPADVYCFMDADLSTDLAALPALIASAARGNVAVGSRFHPRSEVHRSAWRRAVSSCLRLWLAVVLGTKVSDVPCGFKALPAVAVNGLLPAVKDEAWFFDLELVLRAERLGFPIEEMPIVWREDAVPGRESTLDFGRVVRQYLSRTVALRREFGGLPDIQPAPGLRRVLSGIRAYEWAAVLAAAAAVAVLLLAPVAYGLRQAEIHGTVWKGVQFLSSADISVYLSQISQMGEGGWLIDNVYNVGRLTGGFNVFWLTVGRVGRLFGLGPVMTFHAARFALILPLLAACYVAMSVAFTRPRHRLLGLALLAFGSGLGYWWARAFGWPDASAGFNQPIDFFVAEANVFMSLLHSPHFAASWIMFIVALVLFYLGVRQGRLSYALASGIVAAILIEFHPFHAPTVMAVPFVWLAWLTVKEGFRPKRWLVWLILAAFSLPSFAYHWWLTHHDAASSALAQANLTPTPSLINVAVGFGLISALWIFGCRFRPKDTDWRLSSFLFAWTAVQLFLAYSPITFQRRLLEGIEFPMVVLSVPVILAAWEAIHARMGRLPIIVKLAPFVIVCLAVFLPTNLLALYRAAAAYHGGDAPDFFFSADKSAALCWVSGNTPADAAFISSPQAGNEIAGWAGRRVYVGHWASTVDFEMNAYRSSVFFSPRSRGMRHRFAQDMGFGWVWCGPDEIDGGGECPDEEGFSLAYDSGGIRIYRVGDSAASAQ
jgi:glycosyltransferase involved in cell wall biosynthesis